MKQIRIFPQIRYSLPLRLVRDHCAVVSLMDGLRAELVRDARTMEQFLTDLASRTPTPGGGAGSALAGAIGAALGAMSAAYTTGSEKYKDVEPQAKRIVEQFETQRRGLQDLVKRDAEAYAMWVAARELPKETQAQKATRKERLADAREEATRVPEAILGAAGAALTLGSKLVDICNPNLIADVAVSAQLLEACARGACTQVLGNLRSAGQGTDVAERMSKARERRHRCAELARAIEKRVFGTMGLQDDNDLAQPRESAEFVQARVDTDDD